MFEADSQKIFFLLRRLRCQEDLGLKMFGPPSAGTIGGPPGGRWGPSQTRLPLPSPSNTPLRRPVGFEHAVEGGSCMAVVSWGWEGGLPTTGRHWRANGTSRHIQHSPGTPTTGLCKCRKDTSKSTGRSGRQKAATRRNMRREERVTVQAPVKKQQPDGMSHKGAQGSWAHPCARSAAVLQPRPRPPTHTLPPHLRPPTSSASRPSWRSLSP